MHLRRGLFRAWFALSIVWLISFAIFVAWLGGATPFRFDIWAIFGPLPPAGIFLIGKLGLWIAQGFSSNPIFHASWYERSVTNMALWLGLGGTVFSFFQHGSESSWSLPLLGLLAYSLGAGLSFVVLGAIIGVVAYRKRRNVELW